MLVNRLDNLGMLRGRPLLDDTLKALPREIRRAYRNRRVVAKHWLPMEWLVELHATIVRTTGAGTTLSRQLGYFGTQRSFGRASRKVAGLASPSHLFHIASKLHLTYYRHGKLAVLHDEPQLVVARWEACTGFDEHNWQVTFGSCEAMLELARAHHPHVEVVSGGGNGDDYAEITALWR